ncbi:testican-2-like isoform X3 [Megalobrama amblycephala]|uniref:testican-2-like isoform X3 n=1 Tax=Megalobrama amblycephala TaxID=75352 RepID=UPI0020144388|nr:testican-2-like isoform X3 [Megalobrama amblycephala]
MMRGLSVVQLLLVTLSASLMSAREAREIGGGNFMEDEQQWLSTVHQYSRTVKHWNRFRDDDYIRTLESPQGSDESLDTTKDPCQKVKCSRHKVCVAQGYQRAMCVNRKKLEHRIRQSGLKPHTNSCKPCSVTPSTPVCGSDGHNYASQCKLEQQACLAGKDLSVLCSGLCPCVTAGVPKAEPKIKTNPETSAEPKPEMCTGQDLADLGDRLRDWFQLLHGNAKQNNSGRQGQAAASVFDRGLVAGCKDSIGWMFSKLDTSNDLFLDQSELAAINLEKYEVCIRPFFNSCDSYRDGKVSTAEWCLCFWREKPPCLAEIERIQIQEASKRKPGMYIPSCDEDGYYRKLQCDRSRDECWCVDPHGSEATGSRIHGNPDCDELLSSGDFSSGVGWEDEEEKDTDENAEEEEEEEEEAGESDDGGYIW